jgi:hypothetical protein
LKRPPTCARTSKPTCPDIAAPVSTWKIGTGLAPVGGGGKGFAIGPAAPSAR